MNLFFMIFIALQLFVSSLFGADRAPENNMPSSGITLEYLGPHTDNLGPLPIQFRSGHKRLRSEEEPQDNRVFREQGYNSFDDARPQQAPKITRINAKLVALDNGGRCIKLKGTNLTVERMAVFIGLERLDERWLKVEDVKGEEILKVQIPEHFQAGDYRICVMSADRRYEIYRSDVRFISTNQKPVPPAATNNSALLSVPLIDLSNEPDNLGPAYAPQQFIPQKPQYYSGCFGVDEAQQERPASVIARIGSLITMLDGNRSLSLKGQNLDLGRLSVFIDDRYISGDYLKVISYGSFEVELVIIIPPDFATGYHTLSVRTVAGEIYGNTVKFMSRTPLHSGSDQEDVPSLPSSTELIDLTGPDDDEGEPIPENGAQQPLADQEQGHYFDEDFDPYGLGSEPGIFGSWGDQIFPYDEF